MSARDEFFKRVQDNSDAEKDNAVRVRNDVQHFRSAMDTLVTKIQAWMDGSGVEVHSWNISLVDQSISMLPGKHPNQYDIAAVRMKNQDRIAELKPTAVYGGGARGWATLNVISPHRAPSTEKFQLRLDRETAEWIIRRENQRTAEGSPFNEETFFQAISDIA